MHQRALEASSRPDINYEAQMDPNIDNNRQDMQIDVTFGSREEMQRYKTTMPQEMQMSMPFMTDSPHGMNPPHVPNTGQGMQRNVPYMNDNAQGMQMNSPHMGDEVKQETASAEVVKKETASAEVPEKIRTREEKYQRNPPSSIYDKDEAN